mgnify:CR=1 FL=1|jgi:hypothetical protein
MFKFHCPHCNQRIEADDSDAGQKVDCPACSEAFTVPFPDKAPPPLPPTEILLPKKESSPPPRPKKRVSMSSPSRSKATAGPPASEQQLRCLAAHGQLEDRDYSKKEAIGLIGDIKASGEKPNYELADQSRNLIWKIQTRATKKEVKRLEKKIAATGSSGKDTSDLEDDLEDCREELIHIEEEKKEWKEAEREEKEEAKERIKEFQEYLGPYGEWTDYIKKPNQTQIKQVVEALDEHEPEWEYHHGVEPLVASLISSFPELEKKNTTKHKTVASGESSGCLVLITAIALLLYCIGSVVA